jgi:hypothetical protein
MHAVLRSYSGQGAKELFDVLERSKSEIGRLARGIDGFVGFDIVRTPEGGFTVSIYRDKAGADESVRVAREWIAKNGGNITAAPPAIAEGAVVLDVR